MLSTTCHCGAVQITIPRAPGWLTNCNCSICRRYGVLWAYFPVEDVQIQAAPGDTEGYIWGRQVLRFVRCRHCGCLTHWERVVPVPGSKMGVNARNFDPLMLEADLQIELLDGAADED